MIHKPNLILMLNSIEKIISLFILMLVTIQSTVVAQHVIESDQFCMELDTKGRIQQ